MRREGLLDLNEAVQNPGKQLTFEVQTELANEEDIDLIAPITGHISVVSLGSALLIEGEFTTKLISECARCAGPLEQEFEFSMSDEFDVEGLPSCYAPEGHATLVNEEPHHIFEKNSLMQDVYIRQGLILNMPTQPLCKFGWEGNCPNAEKTEIEKPAAQGHPAMQLLEQFKKSEKE